MRPGRLDRIMYVGPPDLASRAEILAINFKKMAVHPDVDVQALAALVCRLLLVGVSLVVSHDG